MPGLQEWLVIMLIALFVFGPDRLPEAGRTLGRGVRKLRDGLNSSRELQELRDEMHRFKQDLSGMPSHPGAPQRLPSDATRMDLDAT